MGKFIQSLDDMLIYTCCNKLKFIFANFLIEMRNFITIAYIIGNLTIWIIFLNN